MTINCTANFLRCLCYVKCWICVRVLGFLWWKDLRFFSLIYVAKRISSLSLHLFISIPLSASLIFIHFMAQQLQRYWLIFLYFYKVNLSLLLFLQIECSENGQICTFLYSPAFVFQDFALCLSLNLQREHSSGLKCLLGVDFNNILWVTLAHSDPKSNDREQKNWRSGALSTLAS